MKTLKNILFGLVFIGLVAAPTAVMISPQNTYAAVTDKTCEVGILGIPPWYKNLAIRDSTGECTVSSPGSELNGAKLELSDFIWRVVMNVIEIALYLVGYISVFFILYGGFQFLTGGDNPSRVESARKTILNAIIGLVISISAVIIVNVIFGIIG